MQDRFRMLTGGCRTALPRQQTLRALVDWSYDLLSDQERLLFDRLSVFADGWTLEAAEAVCADHGGGRKMGEQSPTKFLGSEEILDLLGHLLEKSMVVAERSADGTARYRLLETLQQYAQERLATRGEGATDALRARHATYFVALGEQVALGMRGPDQVQWSDRLEIERQPPSALEWARPLMRRRSGWSWSPPATNTLHPFLRGWPEARQHRRCLPSQRGADARAQARALRRRVIAVAGPHTPPLGAAERKPSLAEHWATRTFWLTRDATQAVSTTGRYGAGRHHEKALQLSRADGDVYGIRWSLEDLGDMAADEGDSAHAENLYEEALSLARQIGDQFGIASILQCMGNLARTTGKANLAGELIREALSVFMQTVRGRDRIAWCLRDLAFVASASGQPERVVRLLGAADAVREGTGIAVPATSVGTTQETLREARQRLGEVVYAAAWSEGRAMSLPQATAYALEPSAPLFSSS